MLKYVEFQNVGLFSSSEKTKIECSNSGGTGKGRLGLLVGPNGTGKSMVFECVRRCLPNQGLWRNYDEKKMEKWK